MEIMSIERSTYEGNRLAATLVEELLTGFNSFVAKMKEMASKGKDKGLGDWPILKSTVRCTISLRMWKGFCMLWQVEIRIARCITSKRSAYERTDNAS